MERGSCTYIHPHSAQQYSCTYMQEIMKQYTVQYVLIENQKFFSLLPCSIDGYSVHTMHNTMGVVFMYFRKINFFFPFSFFFYFNTRRHRVLEGANIRLSVLYGVLVESKSFLFLPRFPYIRVYRVFVYGVYISLRYDVLSYIGYVVLK